MSSEQHKACGALVWVLGAFMIAAGAVGIALNNQVSVKLAGNTLQEKPPLESANYGLQIAGTVLGIMAFVAGMALFIMAFKGPKAYVTTSLGLGGRAAQGGRARYLY